MRAENEAVTSPAPTWPAGAPDATRTIELEVISRRDAAEGVVVLTLAPPAPTRLPSWSPGAHVDLVLDTRLVRQYSLCGDPRDGGHYQVAVLFEPGGRGGSRLVHQTLHEGQRVEVRGPRNHFALQPSPRYLFIAGGIGITPILPMLATAEAGGAHWRLVYGGRARRTMAFLDQLARYGDRVEVRPESEYGPLDLDALLSAPERDTLVYCCGPEGLLAAVEARCAAWPESSLHVERFTTAPREYDVDTGNIEHAFTVHFERSGLTAQVPHDESIFDVAENNGVPVSASCFDGVCGTCETHVLEGEPDHRDCVLDAEEKAANRTMMICVSRCKGTHLRLDL